MGETRTLAGQNTAASVSRIRLFAGDFKRGFRITSFVVAPQDPGAAQEISARLLTEEASHNVNWNWSSNRQIGWAAWNVPTNSRFAQFSHIDVNSIVVEDVWLDLSGSADTEINWSITFEQVSLTEWEGALALVRGRAQGAD